MKRIVLGSVNVSPAPGVPAQAMSVAEVLRGWLSMGSPQRGMNFEEMGLRLDLIKRFRSAGDAAHLDLEDPEHAVLTTAMNDMRFTVADEGLFEARNRVVEAKAP